MICTGEAATINLPDSLFERINNPDDVGIFFALYNTPILFPVGEQSATNNTTSVETETRVGSLVAASSVGPDIASTFDNLEDNVTVILELQTEEGVRAMGITVMIVGDCIYMCRFFGLVQRGVSLGTLTFKTGPHKAVLPLLVKMVLSLAAATISPTLPSSL